MVMKLNKAQNIEEKEIIDKEMVSTNNCVVFRDDSETQEETVQDDCDVVIEEEDNIHNNADNDNVDVDNFRHHSHPAGTVLPFLSAACNVTARIGDHVHMGWRFHVFCSK